MKIIVGYPPNYLEICAALPAVKTSPRAIFTYGNKIYNPGGGKIPQELETHERTHSERQAKIGVKNWWNHYLRDSRFRFDEELLAYQAQYEATYNYHKKVRRIILNAIAKDLSGPLYGRLVGNRAEARKLITKGAE